jgi:hypothetical protein
MKKSKKPFDAVHLMRQIRDKFSKQIKDMSFEEQQRYMRERLAAARSTPTQQPESGTHAA